jgi:hypothetical protein
MNIICCLLNHDWEKIGEWLPIRPDKSSFSDDIEIMAMGKCKRCGTKSPRPMYGTFTVGLGGKHSVTISEAMKIWEADHD